MPLPSLRKRLEAALDPPSQQDEPSEQLVTPDAEAAQRKVDAPPAMAPSDKVGGGCPEQGHKAVTRTAFANPPAKSETRSACGAAAEEDDAPVPVRVRGAWLAAGLTRLAQLPMTLQVVLVAVPILAVSWPWIFPPAPRRASRDAFSHLSDDFGPDGYPRMPVAQADRKVTEQDVALMIHAGGRDRKAAAPTQQAEQDGGRHARVAKAAALRPAVTRAETVAARPRRSVRFYGPGGTLEGPQEKASDMAALPIGTRIAVVLDVGTSTAHRGAVMGRVIQDVVSPQGQLVLGAGAFLKGRASGDFEAGRMFVDFDQAVVSGKTLRLQGYAIAHDEPGVAASRREITPQERQKASLADGVLETAKDVAGRVGEGVASALTRNVAHRSISQMQKDMTSQPSYVLSLPAGARFEVLVTG